jgi:hypothetical protein
MSAIQITLQQLLQASAHLSIVTSSYFSTRWLASQDNASPFITTSSLIKMHIIHGALQL